MALTPQQEGRLRPRSLGGWFLGAPVLHIISPDQSRVEKHSENNERPFLEELNRREREKLTKGNKSFKVLKMFNCSCKLNPQEMSSAFSIPVPPARGAPASACCSWLSH